MEAPIDWYDYVGWRRAATGTSPVDSPKIPIDTPTATQSVWRYLDIVSFQIFFGAPFTEMQRN